MCVCHFSPWEPRIFQEPSWEKQPGQGQIFRMVKEGLDAAKAAGRDYCRALVTPLQCQPQP